MTISTTVNRASSVPDGIVVTFYWNFLILDEDHLKVYLDDTLESPALYGSITGIGNPAGGSLTYTIAPTGSDLTILREVPLTQLADYVAYGKFPSDTHETGLDLLTMIAQQLEEKLGRTISLPISSTITELAIAALEANKAVVVNGTADGLIMGPTVDEITNAQTYATNALASQVAAAASEVAAAASEAAADADATQTALDVIATAADVISTAADAVATAADRVQTGLDAAATAADVISTAADAVATALDVVSTNADVVSTNADAAATAADAAATALDAAATAADVIAAAASAAAAAASAYMDIAATISGVPADSQTCLVFVAVRAFDLPASLTGSRAESLTAAAASTDFDIKVNGVSKGTINFAAAAKVATFTFASLVSIADGDVISIHNQATADTTLANIGFTLKGSLP